MKKIYRKHRLQSLLTQFSVTFFDQVCKCEEETQTSSCFKENADIFITHQGHNQRAQDYFISVCCCCLPYLPYNTSGMCTFLFNPKKSRAFWSIFFKFKYSGHGLINYLINYHNGNQEHFTVTYKIRNKIMKLFQFLTFYRIKTKNIKLGLYVYSLFMFYVTSVKHLISGSIDLKFSYLRSYLKAADLV